MKTIIAIIKPFKLDEVKEAIEGLGHSVFSVTEAKDFGSRESHTELYRGHEYAVTYLPRVELSVTVPDDNVDKVVQAILKAAKSGRRNDGRITVVNVEQFFSIGTNEQESKPAKRSTSR